MAKDNKDPEFSSELEWIKFRQDTLGEYAFTTEGTSDKFMRKVKSNPLVPVGALMTVGALTYGLWCFRKGRGLQSQYMMRARVLAQGFTVVAILGGFFLSASATGKESSPNALPASK